MGASAWSVQPRDRFSEELGLAALPLPRQALQSCLELAGQINRRLLHALYVQ